MDLRYYLNVARRHWLILVVSILMGVALAGTYLYSATPQYTATSSVLVVTDPGKTTTGLVQSNDFSQSQIKSYIAIATKPIVMNRVIRSVGLDTTAEDLADQVQVTSPLNTVVITITATDPSPQQAAEIADSLADQLATVINRVAPKRPNGDSRVRLESVESAVVPTAPSSPNVKLTLLAGLLGGLVVGIGIVAIKEMLDTRVRTVEDATEIVDRPVLGIIPFDSNVNSTPVILDANEQTPRAESFRRLRTGLQFLDAAESRTLFAITSSIPQEGKSVVAANLAVALANAGQKTCLVEADLRRPRVSEYLGIDSGLGLTTVLLGEVTLEDATAPFGRSGLDVLPAGELPPNPSEMLGSSGMRDLLAALERSYDVVIVDCAPLLPVTDGAIVAEMAGGALLVVGSRSVHRHELAGAVDGLESIGVPVLGIIVNALKTQSARNRYYTYESNSGSAGRKRTDARPPGPPSEDLQESAATQPLEAGGDWWR